MVNNTPWLFRHVESNDYTTQSDLSDLAASFEKIAFGHLVDRVSNAIVKTNSNTLVNY